MIGVLDPNYAIQDDGSVFVQPFGPIIYKTNLPEEVLHNLDVICETVRHKDEYDIRQTLAGNIENEKRIVSFVKDNEIVTESICRRLAEMYCVYNNIPPHTYRHFSRKIELDDIWVNFQKANEWNPMHYHGGDYSYVIYLKNEVNLDNERLHPTQVETNSPFAGKILFRYGEAFNNSNNTVTIQPVRGDMFVFPSFLNHQVAPFTEQDKERISIAGNVYIDNLMPIINDGENIL